MERESNIPYKDLASYEKDFLRGHGDISLDIAIVGLKELID